MLHILIQFIINCQLIEMSAYINPYLQYISVFMESPKVAEKLEDLIDCLTLNDLLSMIPEFPLGKIEEAPITFAHIFSNLKNTYRRLQKFWNENLGKELECREIDLVDIAHNGNQKQFVKLIDLFVQSAILSSEKEFFIHKILETSLPTQQFFKQLVEQTMEERRTFSPRKKREQRLIDKMLELQHENENLQNVISEICQQKFEIQQRFRQLYDKIAEKDSEILKLSDQGCGLFSTPQRKNVHGIYDSVEKNNEYIERLKSKILKMTKDHEKQLYDLNEKLQCYTIKLGKLEQLENYLDMYRVRIETNEIALKEYEQKEKQFLTMKIQCLEKDQLISVYTNKLLKQSDKIRQLQDCLLQKNIEIEKRNVQIQELSKVNKSSVKNERDDSFLKITPLSIKNSISMFEAETMNKYDLNSESKNMVDEIEELQDKLRSKDIEIEKQKKLIENIKLKNHKLATIIEEKIERDGQISGVCLKNLKMYVREKQIRKKLESTIETATSTLNSRISSQKRRTGKENYGGLSNQSEFNEYRPSFSADKNQVSSKKTGSATLSKKPSFFSKY